MQEINLHDLLCYYARNWLNLLSALLVGAIIGLVYTAFIQTPLYKSEATMLVVGARTSATDTTLNNNYTELFKSRLVLQTTMSKQGYDGSYEQLLARTTATNDKNTDVLKVSVADPDAKKSQRLLSASVETFKAQASKIYGSSNIKTVDVATLPSTPYNVNVAMQIGLAMTVALFVTIIVLFFIYDYTSTYKINTSNDSESKATSKKPTAKKKASKKASKPSEDYIPALVRKLTAMLASVKKSYLTLMASIKNLISKSVVSVRESTATTVPAKKPATKPKKVTQKSKRSTA